MSRDECREAVVAWFEEHGLLDHVEDHHHSVMHCYRCDSTLEPWLSEQWFVAVDKLKGPATEAVTIGQDHVPSASAGRRPTSRGWRTSRTGASRASCGGAIASPCSTAMRLRLGGRAHGGHRGVPELRRASRAPGRGRFGHVVLQPAVDLRHAGLARQHRRCSKGIIPPRRSSPRATSSRCGWRA